MKIRVKVVHDRQSHPPYELHTEVDVTFDDGRAQGAGNPPTVGAIQATDRLVEKILKALPR